MQSLENQTQENYSSQISIQQVLVTSKVAREVQRQTRQQPSVFPLNEKFTEIQPHLFNAVLNPLAPIRAGPSLIEFQPFYRPIFQSDLCFYYLFEREIT